MSFLPLLHLRALNLLFGALKADRDHCRRRKGVHDVVIMRASQLDAARLDNELTAMLREQFMRIFSLFQPACAQMYLSCLRQKFYCLILSAG